MNGTTKYIYICGSGHSGSTLLGLLLGSHSAVVSLGEVMNLAQCMSENQQCTCCQPVRACPFWNDVRSTILRTRGIDMFERPDDFPVALINKRRTLVDQLVHYQRLALAWQGFRPLARLELMPRRNTSTRSIVMNIFHLYDAVRAVTGCQAVVDASKSPIPMKWLWMHSPLEVKVLYLVRDGRAVIASNMRKGSSAQAAVRGWAKTALLARLMFQTMPASAWSLVRYEDLCNNPARELQRICTFLSLEFSPDMLEFRNQVHHEIDGNRMRFGTSSAIVNRETWRQALSQADLRIFERLAGPINRRLGYSD